MCTVDYHVALNKKIRENYDRKILSKTEDYSNKKEKQNLAYTVHLFVFSQKYSGYNFFLAEVRVTTIARKLHGHEGSV